VSGWREDRQVTSPELHERNGPAEPALPPVVAAVLQVRGLPTGDETTLCQALEAHLPGYCLYRLMPAAIKRWRVRYRLIAGNSYYDGQSAGEAYARALLACVEMAAGEDASSI
jgi:hypothetical protein